MPTTINNLEVFHTEVVFVPNDGSVWIDYGDGTETVKVNIQLVTNAENPQSIGSRTSGRGDHALIELTNWFGIDESAFARPSRLGVTADGRVLSVFVHGKNIGSYLRLEIQFYFGELDD
ncbi:hypothetical protein G5Y08_000011 [Vibrio parahaemolyticus]|nr:hypothetical protein [Vibrio parahaemolyticus]EHD2279002.1 hypothetical protein [Vibrio parahaemolyticus]EHH2495016.1 hypothetical protein [Vibrio parahaemolyticus]EHR0870707.1 hypothetical protein [Vibrio parahaemolyticus]EID4327251.1 hypothetical protein [Vibrio parahaemolyticus]